MSYKIEFDKFFSYSFSLDCLIFGFKDGMIHLLSIKRNMDPFKGEWAIPGDLVYPDEDLPEAAERILKELTDLKGIKLHQSQTFGKPNRHPQGRVITCAYFALTKINEVVSPTFNIVQTYPLQKDEEIWHCDFYRINSFEEVEEIGVFEDIKKKLFFLNGQNLNLN